MKTFVVKRIAHNEECTQGVLIDEMEAFALTLEPPWKDNKPNISCIPSGIYICKRINSPSFGDTFEITDVPHRSNILFHKGNISENTMGCVLIAEEFGYLNNKIAIISSKKGFNEFMEKLKKNNQFQLNILWC